MSFIHHWGAVIFFSVIVVALLGCVAESDPELIERAQEAASKSKLALFQAIEARDEELALAILRVKSHELPKDKDGRTALMVAAKTRSTRIAWELLPEQATNLSTDQNGLSALTYAARAEEAWLVKELLNRGASANVHLPKGGTLIAECLIEGRSAITSLLLNGGANIESKN